MKAFLLDFFKYSKDFSIFDLQELQNMNEDIVNKDLIIQLFECELHTDLFLSKTIMPSLTDSHE